MPVVQVVSLVALSVFALACTSTQEIEEHASSIDTASLRTQAQALFGTIPESMPGSEKDTEAKIKLGKKLYFETKLSINGTQSCNSCHNVLDKAGGVDNEATSPGAEGKRGDRNSPTVLNAGFHVAQFWDGRAADLVAQAKGPILNPIEMGMPSEEAALEALKADPAYEGMFSAAFPDAETAFSYHNLAEAIAAFERTLITKDRFDAFQNGDDKALNVAEQQGLQTFIETGCIACHAGPLLGGQLYQKMGAVHPYENKEDLGRIAVTGQQSDTFMFKVPSLRNIAITQPYFHDGAASTLEEAVEQMAWLQLGKELDEETVSSIVTFLQSLTDIERQ